MTLRRLCPWLLVAAGACGPTTIAEAEARGNIAWLEQYGTPEAVAAIGRIADKNPKAVLALQARSSFDVEAFKAAWAGVMRGASWGGAFLREGLADPKRADSTATAMEKGEPHLVPFLDDLESALVRLSASKQNSHVSNALASVGPLARAAVERRLSDAATRGAMCRGIASKDSTADARKALIEVPEAARDDLDCIDAIIRAAVDDDTALDWMAKRGEPGILGIAGKSAVFPCARLHLAWVQAMAERPAAVYSALSVPLAYAVTRCAPQMDGVLADSIVHLPALHGVVMLAIDPFASYGDALHATCAKLPLIARGRDTPVVRERANDALRNACSQPRG